MCEGCFHMRDVTFTVYLNQTARRGTPVKQSWAKWVEDLVEYERRDSKDGNAVILGRVPEDKNRSKKHVDFCDAIGIDIEHKTEEQIEVAFEALSEFEFVCYETYSSTSEDPRYRVVVPFTESVSPEKWPDVWISVNRFIGYINDPSTKDCSRLHFLPSCPQDAEPGSFHNGTGKFLSLDDLEAATTLDDVVNRLRGIKNLDLKPLADALRNGEPYAKEGERHDSTLKLTLWLANKARPLTRDEFDQLFGPSVAAMSWDIEEAWTCYDTAVDKVADERPSSEPTSEDLQALSRVAELHGKDSWAGLAWLLLGKNAIYYVLRLSGEYNGPFDKTEANAFLRRELEDVPHIETTVWTEKGLKNKTLNALTEEYGYRIERLILDMTASISIFENGTFVESVCQVNAAIKPVWHDEVDEWLQIFGGEHYERLCEWLASAPHLDRSLCALYLKGPKGCGKSLFTVGLARLWDSTPVELHNIFDSFNESLVRVPIVVAEEAVPRNWRGMPATTRLRALITEPSRELLRKYRTPAEMRGYIRLILTSNNDELLRGDIHTQEDLHAIAQRFLMITAKSDATDYLLSLEDVDAWRRENVFAEHVMFLAENMEVVKAGRFWVEGNAEEMSLGLMVGSHWNSRVCQWLVQYLMSPNLVASGMRGTIRRRDGGLYVNEQALLMHWQQYFPGTREEPEIERIASALRTVSTGRGRVRRGYKGVKLQYHQVDVNMLLLWVDRTGVGDHETILATLGEDSDDDPSWNEQEGEDE